MRWAFGFALLLTMSTKHLASNWMRAAFILVSGGGSGRIRTPGWLPTARFQVICAHVQTGPRML